MGKLADTALVCEELKGKIVTTSPSKNLGYFLKKTSFQHNQINVVHTVSE